MRLAHRLFESVLFAALPAAGASALWKYKAIYRLHDEQVGQWSDVITTMVAG